MSRLPVTDSKQNGETLSYNSLTRLDLKGGFMEREYIRPIFVFPRE